MEKSSIIELTRIMTKYLVSGSSGFLGTHLKNRLKGTVVALPRELLLQPDKLKKFVVKTNPDVIIHCAAYGNMSYQKVPQDIFEANVIGSWNLLNACREIDFKAFVNIGSSSEYGEKSQPMSEGDVPETTTFYGASKVASTYLARASAFQFNKPIVTVRPFSVYGPAEADFRFIPTIMRCILKNEHMALVDGNHDWVFVDDFIDGILEVIAKLPEVKGRVVNIGTGIQTSNYEIVKRLASFAGKNVADLNLTQIIKDTDTWVADARLANYLGWKPNHTLAEGLKKTFDYYKEIYES